MSIRNTTRAAAASVAFFVAFVSPVAHATTARLLAHHDPWAQTTTLVDDSGQPIGGRFQAWVNESQMPTVPGRLIFEPTSQLCGRAVDGCSEGPPFYASTYKLAASYRYALYFELGHLFDWRYLTDRDRRWLAQQWQTPRTPWLNSVAGMTQGTEDGLEGDFAAVYQECAQDRHASIAGLALDPAPGSDVVPVAIQPRTDASTCAFIERVARRAAAVVARRHRP